MSDEWAEMLQSAGIEGSSGGEGEPGMVPELMQGSLQVIDLSEYSVFQVTGADASLFLQGQFCNDLSKVSSTRVQITGYCTPKGRLIALPIIVGFESGFRMIVHTSIKDAFIKRLRMFVMRSDVLIEESENLRCIGLIADDQGNLGGAAESIGAVPHAPMDVATSTGQQVIRWYDDHVSAARARYLVIADSASQLDLWKQTGDAPKFSQSRWRLGDISAGVPSITSEVVDAFVPQMINLQLIDGLSFTKGCYPGQEIVARMQYLGKLKRHMRLFHQPLLSSSSSKLASAGDVLKTEGSADAGIVVDAVRCGNDHVALLAVVKVSVNEQSLEYDETVLTAVEMPYDLPSMSTDCDG